MVWSTLSSMKLPESLVRSCGLSGGDCVLLLSQMIVQPLLEEYSALF